MYGRLRRIAALTAGRCEHFVSVGGVPAYRGWTDPWQYDPAGLPVPRREDAELVADPDIDSKGYRIVRTEEAVFAAHPQAAHFRYPYLYGPLQPVPREWLVVRRILDGRDRMIIADEGLTLHHQGYTENAAAAVLLAIEHPERSAGTIFNIGDEEVLTVRQMIELCAGSAGRRARARSRCRTTSPCRPGRCSPSRCRPTGCSTSRCCTTSSATAMSCPRGRPPGARRVWLAENPPRARRHRGDGADRSVRLRRRGRAHRLVAGGPGERHGAASSPSMPGYGLAYSGPLGPAPYPEGVRGMSAAQRDR